MIGYVFYANLFIFMKWTQRYPRISKCNEDSVLKVAEKTVYGAFLKGTLHIDWDDHIKLLTDTGHVFSILGTPYHSFFLL